MSMSKQCPGAPKKAPRNFQKNPALVDELAAELKISIEDSPFVTCKVAEGEILGSKWQTRTFKVLSTGRHGNPVGYGPDDSTYAEHPDLLRTIPRAFTRLYINGDLVYSLEGVTKFDGTTTYDNDEDLPPSQHGLLDHKKVQQWQTEDKLEVSYQPKHNGKFAIFTLLKINDHLVLFGGSKNCHVPVVIESNEVDEDEPFFKIAADFDGNDLHHDILRCITRDLGRMHYTEVTQFIGKTFIGEYCDGKHMVWTAHPYMVVTPLPDEKDPEQLDIDYYSYYETGFAGYSVEQLVNAKKRDIYIRNYLIDRLCAKKCMAHNVLRLAGQDHKVAVIMQGAPGSGKTALTSVLIESIQRGESESPVTCERFCTDDIFERNGGYDADKLKQFHDENFDAFAASTADVKFCENTNCQQWEWSRYAKAARDAGYIVIVLTMKENDPEVLVRNVHNVPVNHLERMCRKLKPAVPLYYGLFLKDQVKTEDFAGDQKTALHVTCKFVGGDTRKDYPTLEARGLGNTEEITVIGISTNPAGRALVVLRRTETEVDIAHVTLSTNNGFTPVEVGQMINRDDLDTTLFGKMYSAIHSAMF